MKWSTARASPSTAVSRQILSAGSTCSSTIPTFAASPQPVIQGRYLWPEIAHPFEKAYDNVLGWRRMSARRVSRSRSAPQPGSTASASLLRLAEHDRNPQSVSVTEADNDFASVFD
jgi:hypothetical protein